MECPCNRSTAIHFLSDNWEFGDDNNRHIVFVRDDMESVDSLVMVLRIALWTWEKVPR